MTKEEILEKYIGAPIPLVGDERATRTIELAMDEFAKQESMAFHLFVMNEIWQYNSSENTWHQYNWESEGVSYDVVWNQFIEQQNR